jgi:hypothetical protein
LTANKHIAAVAAEEAADGEEEAGERERAASEFIASLS